MKKIERTIKKAKAGESKAFEYLYKETYDRNYYIIYKMLKNEQDTLDVLQETYIKVFTKLEQFTYKGPDSFCAWTGRIAVNMALDFLRKKKPVLFTEIERNDEDGMTEFEIEDPSLQFRPEIVYDRKETADIVEEMLNCLSEEQRVCILMYYLQDMSIKEIAQICNCSENTIKSRLYYGRRKICQQEESLKKRGILLSGIAPVAWLVYALKQDVMAAKAPVAAAELCQELLKGTWMQWGAVNRAGAAGAAAGKGSAIAKIGVGKVLAVVAAGSLGVGLTAGIFLGKNLNINHSHIVTEQEFSEKTETESATTEKTTEMLTEETTTAEKTTAEKTSEAPTTKEETTQQTTEKKTEQTAPSTERSTQVKTTATTESDKVEWDDDYIEWDD